jgi:NADH-quinone oxidoreductase subunit J
MVKIFYFLKFSCIFCALFLVIVNYNPIYSVLSIVILFVSGSIILLLLGVDFLPYVFIIVYAGAIAVLFLFIVIILKIKLRPSKINLKNLNFVFLLSLFLTFLNYTPTLIETNSFFCDEYIKFDSYSNLTNLGKILYTEYSFHFVISGLILLVAIIGAIYLTRINSKNSASLKQKIYLQKTRSAYIGKVTKI